MFDFIKLFFSNWVWKDGNFSAFSLPLNALLFSRFFQQGTTKVVFAYHTEDPKSENNIKKHTFRGSRSILLLNKLDKKTVDEKGWKQFDVFSYNVGTCFWSLLQDANLFFTKTYFCPKSQLKIKSLITSYYRLQFPKSTQHTGVLSSRSRKSEANTT